MNTLINRINELRAQGLTDTKVRAFLILEDFSAKDITAAFKELGGAKADSFKSTYYTWLSEARRSRVDAEVYIIENGSDNVIKHKGAHMSVWELADMIWASKGGEAPKTEETVEEEPKVNADVEAAHKILDAAEAKVNKFEEFTRAEANKIHPDKFAKYNDEYLTKRANNIYKRIVIVAKKRAA